MATKYIARFDGQIVGHRTTKDRTYTHAIVVFGHGNGPSVASWCGRLDLAQTSQRNWSRNGYSAEIVSAEIAPSKKSLTQAQYDGLVEAGITPLKIV